MGFLINFAKGARLLPNETSSLFSSNGYSRVVQSVHISRDTAVGRSSPPRPAISSRSSNSPRRNQMNLVHNSKVSATERSDAYPKNKKRKEARKEGRGEFVTLFGVDTAIQLLFQKLGSEAT